MAYEKTWTRTLTDASITIDGAWGIRLLAIKCTSATAGSYIGGGTVGQYSSSAIALAQNDSVSLIVADGVNTLDGIVITAPSGCTLIIQGQI